MQRICLICDNAFTTSKKKRKFCSKKCQFIGQSKPKIIATCKTCGKTFEVGRDCKGKYCSRKCQHLSMKVPINYAERTQLAHAREREIRLLIKLFNRTISSCEYEFRHIKTCTICGKSYSSKRTTSRFCSKECYKKYDNSRRDKRIYRNGKPDLTISLNTLYERDKGVCRICGRQINFEANSNSNDYPSIDHIIPIAKGGKHEWSNVQLACRGCNTKKREA